MTGDFTYAQQVVPGNDTHIHWPIGVVHSSADNFPLVYKDAAHWSLSLRQRLLSLNFNVSWITWMVG